ncbi:FAD-dependent oxidoreductase [Cyanobium sp. FGCU-52]|nr:FAD-dependent oxidoreductase [Cyanobium sp. FGCU52]
MPRADQPGSGSVVIAGGGFAGLYTALALAGRPSPPPILLIEPGERFLFLPLLYELLSGELHPWEIAPRYDALLAGRGVAWLQDRVERIDTSSRTLLTRRGRTLPYGRLVLATGAGENRFGIPGADSHALGFRSLADVDRLRQLVERLKREPRPLQRLVVVGGGPTGVELACKLADLLTGAAGVEVIEQGPTLLPDGKAFSRDQAQRALQRRDVRVRTGTRVLAVDTDGVKLGRPGSSAEAAMERLGAAGVIWTAGLAFHPPTILPEPARDPVGRLLCDATLALPGDGGVFVAGDLARPSAPTGSDDPAAVLPANAQVAFQQAPLLADNLLRSLAGEPLAPFRWQDLGEMMSLGRGDACLTAGGLTLAGPLAFRLRRLAYLARMPGLNQQLRAAAGWLAEAWPSASTPPPPHG